MSDEMQYVNPIIQAMVATSQSANEKANREQEAEKLKQAAAQFSAMLPLHKHANDLENRRLDLEEQKNHSMIDIQKAIETARIQQERAGTFHTLSQMFAGGQAKPEAFQQQPIAPTPATPGSGISGVPSIPLLPGKAATPGTLDLSQFGLGQVPQTAFSNPEEQMKILRAKAGAEAGGQAEGAEPFKIAEEGRQFGAKKQLQDWENEFKGRMEDKNIASKESMAKLERSTQFGIANMENATKLKLGGMGPDSSGLRPVIMSGILGQAKLDPKNPIERAALDSIQQAGYRPLDPSDRQALQQMESLNPTFDKLSSFVNKYLPSEAELGSKGASFKGMYNKLVSGTASPLPTDAKNQMKEIGLGAMNSARALEGLTGGRVTGQMMDLAIQGLTEPGITKEQGLDRIKNLKDMFVNKQQNQILGGMPASQKAELYKTYGITPPELVGTPKVNLKGHKLDVPGSLQAGQPIYQQED